MRYIIDTYNLVHAAAGLSGTLSQMTVRKLCQYIAASADGMKATLVLDGRAKPDEPSENEFPEVTLVYSGTGVPADVVIGQMVEQAAHRRKVTVVSDDREVAAQARRNFVRVMGCQEFLRQLTQYNARAAVDAMPPKKVSGTPTTGEADHWMKEFGFEEESQKAAKPRASAGDGELGGLRIEDLLGPKE